MDIWKHKTETATSFRTEPPVPPAPPVALVTGDLHLTGTVLLGVQIPLEQFNDQIANNGAYWFKKTEA